MKYKALRLIALLVLLASISSCGDGRWRRYNYQGHYIHKKHYRSWHEHHNRDW